MTDNPDAFGIPRGGDDESILWSNGWAKEFWGGALTPIHYSVRAIEFERNHRDWRRAQGLSEVAAMPLFKYRRGTAYINTAVERAHYEALMPKRWRAGMLRGLHPEERGAAAAAPLDPVGFVRAIAGMQLFLDGCGPLDWTGGVRKDLDLPAEKLDGPAAAELRELGDAELVDHVERLVDFVEVLNLKLWAGFFIHVPWATSILREMLDRWCGAVKGADELMQSLLSGLPGVSTQLLERFRIWDLGRRVAGSAALRERLAASAGAEFFDGLADGNEEEREFLAEYRLFVEEFGHTGASERDVYHPRRAEDPTLDLVALSLLSAADDSRSPADRVRAQAERRELDAQSVVDELQRQPLGFLRVEAFRLVLGYVQNFWTLRENQRHDVDRVVMAKKRAFQEIGRRLHERGLLAVADDVFFLSWEEAQSMLAGSGSPPPAALAARREAFELVAERAERPPTYLRGSEPLAEPPAPTSARADGIGLLGDPISRGTAAGATARIVESQRDLARLRPGDVMVCPGADHGWAAAFPLVDGVIVESGGSLSASGCMAREQGIPALVVADATRLIPDGSRIDIDANGEIAIRESP